MNIKESVCWNSGGWARACWHYTLPCANPLKTAAEIEQQGYRVEILPTWAARHWCYWANVLSLEALSKGKEKLRYRRIAIAVEKWLITRNLRYR